MHSASLVAVVATLVGATVSCGSSIAPPRQAMADVQAADRAATELGAEKIPNAELHLRLAREQTSSARRLMDDGENERAANVLLRARADAELALALTQEMRARAQAQEAANQANARTNQMGGWQ
jgi:hypothetical protein